MYFRFLGRLAAAAAASALCPREKEQRLCGPGTASANGITPRRRTLLRSTRSGEQQVPVLGSRAYRNHSTRLRDFPLPRGEGRCELVRKYAQRVKNQDRLTARSESSSRREEALISLLFPRKFEPRYLGSYGKWRFQT